MNVVKCRTCGAKIYFDSRFKSKRGKLIPISVSTKSAHKCRIGAPNGWNVWDYTDTEHTKKRIREPDRRLMSNVELIEACEILGVDFGATKDQVNNAYRKLIMTYHPDRYGGKDAHNKTSEINRAYEILTKT